MELRVRDGMNNKLNLKYREFSSFFLYINVFYIHLSFSKNNVIFSQEFIIYTKQIKQNNL